MIIDRDQLIRRVAEKHRLVLTEDDPLITLVTLNEVIFENHTQELVKKMDGQNARVISSMERMIGRSKAEQARALEAQLQTLKVVQGKILEDYGNMSKRFLDEIGRLAFQATVEKKNARIASILAIGFGALFFLANIWLFGLAR